MAYDTGVATSPTDLLDKLRLFLAANGWSVNDYSASGLGYRLHVQKGSLYFNLKSMNGESIWQQYGALSPHYYGIGINGSDGYSAGSDWDKQPGAARQLPAYSSYYIGSSMMCLATGVTVYYFFASGDYVHILVRFINPYGNAAERWSYMSFGTLNKFGTWTGGAYECASRSSYNSVNYGNHSAYANYESPPFAPHANISGCGHVRITHGTIDGWAAAGGSSTGRNTSNTGAMLKSVTYSPANTAFLADLPCSYPMYRSLKNELNGLAILMPITVFYYEDSTDNGIWYPIGNIPDMYWTRVTGFNYGNVYEFGGENYVFAPWLNLTFHANAVNGLAVRKIS